MGKSLSRKSTYTKVEQPTDVTVYVPFTKHTPTLQLVVDCLRIQRVQPELVQVDKGDAYWNLLREAWGKGETFFIVEQDVVIWQGGIHQLAECAERWCTLPTMCHGRMITTTLGCAKFSAELIERRPGFWDDIPSTWYHLDANFADKIGWPFIKPHAHWPAATHLNEVQWPDEVSMRYSLERKMVWRSMEAGEAVASVQYRIPGERGEHFAHATIDQQG